MERKRDHSKMTEIHSEGDKQHLLVFDVIYLQKTF